MGKLSSLILNGDQVNKKLERIAFQIIEEYHNEKELFIVGIYNNGFLLAKKLKALIEKSNLISQVKLIELKINKKQPLKSKVVLNPETSFNNKKIILIDDVLNSGKTLMYAAKHFLTTPILKLSTVVLVDRTHNRFPIKADHVGLSLATTLKEYVNVKLDGEEQGIYLS